MQKSKLSRGTELDTQKCVVQADGNRFNLVLIASERLRELRNQHKHSPERYHTTVDALMDVQNGKVNPDEYLDRIRERKNKS